MATIMSSGVDDDTHSTTSVGEVACFDGGEGDGGHPQVTLSFAQSLDGSITAQRGLAVALSSPESFRMTHSLRARHDAIAVGVGTLLSDNPSLNTRLVQGPSPKPIVFDSSLRCPLDCKLLTMHQTCRKPILVASETALRDDVAVQARRDALVAAGAEIVTVESDNVTGHIDLDKAFEFLTKRYRKIMVEGGASIITSMLGGPARRWITRIVLTVAPCFMGGLRCVQTPLSPKEERNNGNATVEFHRMRFVQVQLMGGDLVVVLDPATSSAAVAAADGAPLK